MHRTHPSYTCLVFLVGLTSLTVVVGACSDEPAVPTVRPLEVDFGEVDLGTRAERRVFIQNFGQGPFKVVDVTTEAPFSARLADENLGVDIGSGGQVPLTVAFSPTAVGEAIATVTIETSGDGSTTLSLPLRGRGRAFSLPVSDDTIDFGRVVAGTTRTISLTVRNPSSVDARAVWTPTDATVALCSSDTPFCVAFPGRTVDADGGFALRGGEEAVVEVRFSPERDEGTRTGAFTVKACDAPQCEVIVRIEGTGVNEGIRCEPSSLDFGLVDPGQCGTRTATCTNDASTSVTVVGWQSSASTSDDFAFDASRTVVLNENDTLGIDVTYCPTSLGEDEGALLIDTNAPSGPIEIPLAGSGGGPTIDVSAETLDFGLATLIAPVRRTLVVTNAGFAPLRLDNIAVDNEGTGAFRLSLPDGFNLGDPLEPGESLELTIEFRPVAVGPVESSLRLVSNDGRQTELTVRLIGEGIDLPACQFDVGPTLDFGVVVRPSPLVRTFEIRNLGAGDCLVTSVRIEPGSDPTFSLVDGPTAPVVIAPGQARAFSVAFRPQAASTFTGAVEFSISAPAPLTFNRVVLSGTGADLGLAVLPRAIDFGARRTGCGTIDRTVNIHNLDAQPTTITSVRVVATNSAFRLSRAPTLPATISPDSRIELEVEFRPTGAEAFAGAIQVEATFGSITQTYFVPLRGVSNPTGRLMERFGQLTVPKVDVLLVLDHSGSMAQQLQAIESNLASFLLYAQEQAIDYRIGVTTNDLGAEGGRICPIAGSPQDRIVSPNAQPDPATALAQILPCTNRGPVLGRGLDSAVAALRAPVLFGHNAGFLRSDALLSIIFASDEADRSLWSPPFYLDYLRALKGQSLNAVSVSALSGPRVGSCSGPLGSAAAGPRFVEMAEQTGGAWFESCTANSAGVFTDLGRTTFGLRDKFLLAQEPVPASVAVSVDGVGVPAVNGMGAVNWTYASVSNSVNFSFLAVPEPGADIEVEYTTTCR